MGDPHSPNVAERIFLLAVMLSTKQLSSSSTKTIYVFSEPLSEIGIRNVRVFLTVLRPKLSRYVSKAPRKQASMPKLP